MGSAVTVTHPPEAYFEITGSQYYTMSADLQRRISYLFEMAVSLDARLGLVTSDQTTQTQR